jgi:hypothetical protein
MPADRLPELPNKAYIDARFADLAKLSSFHTRDAAATREKIVALEETVKAQATSIKDLKFQLSILQNRTRKLVPDSGKPVRLR